ncbi:hypothetical protein HPB49_026173 [Dermacentor silvarum]|nr:hypothetical protein HPB49_026173 [Dermacentor silvarum]
MQQNQALGPAPVAAEKHGSQARLTGCVLNQQNVTCEQQEIKLRAHKKPEIRMNVTLSSFLVTSLLCVAERLSATVSSSPLPRDVSGEFSKVYNSEDVEAVWLDWWEASGIHDPCKEATPEALESLAATLRMQLRDLEQRSAYLDSRLERKRAELDQLQEQSTNNCSAEDATFGPEEQQAILLVLLHVKVVNTHTNFTKQHRLKSHF